MSLLNMGLIGLVLFALTCILCGVSGWLLAVSPLLTVVVLLVGALGVVLMADILQSNLFG